MAVSLNNINQFSMRWIQASRASFCNGLACGVSFVALAVLANAQEIVIERDVAAPMRDGTILRADVYRPADRGTYPVLVCRTPYGKQGLKLENYAKAGYIVVGQDARGRYKSAGEWEIIRAFRDS